ncbi:hypothetical protein [Psychrilyobacter atlanticus]|uniref:hypothetical protein n=1 Tax=Psychrilyobacter atlanticus TaxID=271091 RepID=UPI00040F21B9|nr:hypothetical protein [Psychrilyobacter atlanticus]
MKKLVLLLTMIVSLTTTHELYAKGNSGKDKPEKEKPERDKPEREKPEKNKHEKNIKAEDAQENWGKLKDQYEDLDKSEQKEIKEEITTKKIIRNEIRREMEKNPDLDLSSIPQYDPNNPTDLENLVEKLINDYSPNKINEDTLIALKLAGMSELSINKIENSLSKYMETSEILEETSDETDSSSEDTEEIEI